MSNLQSKRRKTKKKPKKKAPKLYEPKTENSELTEVVDDVNLNLSPADNVFMRGLLGEPRKKADYTSYDTGLDNDHLKSLHITDDVGPFTVTGLALAVEDLKEVMSEIEEEQPEIYAALGTAGMLSVRRVTDNDVLVSNHSWGTAIDLTIDGLLDIRGDNKTQCALIDIAPIFNRHGWYWGAKFRTEDSMHFEISKQTLLGWARLGHLGPDAQKMANGKQTKKLAAARLSAKGDPKYQGAFSVRVLIGQAKARNAPFTSNLPHPSHIFRRRPGEPYQRWLTRTATSWAKRTSSWFLR